MPSVAEKLAHDKGFTTVTFDGNTYQHTTPLEMTPGRAPAKIEVLDAEGAGTNGSGESKASSEALRRFTAAKGKGSIVIEQAGRPDKPVIDADHFVQSRDNLQPGQKLVRIVDGKRTPVDVTRSPVGSGNKATSMQDIATKAMNAPDAASARNVAGTIIERERGARLSAADKKDMVARVMDIIAERRRASTSE
jgi:hypothetical protein